jgi:hypothetical protein
MTTEYGSFQTFVLGSFFKGGRRMAQPVREADTNAGPRKTQHLSIAENRGLRQGLERGEGLILAATKSPTFGCHAWRSLPDFFRPSQLFFEICVAGVLSGRADAVNLGKASEETQCPERAYKGGQR